MPRKPTAQHRTEPGDYFGHDAVGYTHDDGTKVWARYNPDTRFYEHPSGSNRYLPEGFEVLFDDPTLPLLVRLDFDMIDERPSCQVISLWNRHQGEIAEITSERLRRIPVGRLVQEAIMAAVHRSPSKRGRRKEPPSLVEFSDEYRRIGNRAARKQGQAYTDDHYRRVAEIYRTALHSKDHPTKAVAVGFTVTPSTAGRYVMEARRRGFLGPTEPGKAGERTRHRRAEEEK